MYVIQNLMDRLRPLVGPRGWDYCVLWKLTEDQSAIEWMDCCCGGSEFPQEGAVVDEFNFPLLCKDAVFQHDRSSACELLAQLPPSIALDSGIYAHTLLSNHARWLNFASCSELNIREETVGTKVLIPMLGGLIELFVAKQVPEDPQTVEFITAQCTVSMEEANAAAAAAASSDAPGGLSNFSTNPNDSSENLNLQHDTFLLRRHGSGLPQEQVENDASENSILEMDNAHIELVEPLPNIKLQGGTNNDKDTLRRGRSGSVSENEDELDQAGNEKRPQSKNLVAERKRRKKLNDRLYALRALVPRISKLDRAAIIGDAIEYIKDLQKQAKELQDELEEQSDVEDAAAIQGSKRKQHHHNDHRAEVVPSLLLHTEKQNNRDSSDHNTSSHDHNKPQQMEPQVEVNQIDGKELFVKVFCEHKAGGFVRLMESLDSFGLEVTNANVTSFRSLVSSIFTVEKKDSELIQADHVKDSLLEVTRNPAAAAVGGGWPRGGSDSVGDQLIVDPNHHHHYPLLHNHLLY